VHTRGLKTKGKYVVDAMVSWQRFVSLAFDVADDKGASFDGIQDGGDFLAGLSDVWQADKDSLKQMTERQAIEYLKERVEA
jgi:uncharacterized membrane protein YjdF